MLALRVRPCPFNCKKEYLVFALGEETAAQAVVDSIFWAFRRLKKPRSREMSARSYALYSVCTRLSFSLDFPFLLTFLFSSNFCLHRIYWTLFAWSSLLSCEFTQGCQTALIRVLTLWLQSVLPYSCNGWR